MSQPLPDPLDQVLAALPRDVEPEKALWSQIETEIAAWPQKERRVKTLDPQVRRSMAASRWLQLAAAIVLVVASSFTTWFVMQRSVDEKVLQAQQATVEKMKPVLNAMPASFGGGEVLGPGYQEARAQLSAEFDRRVAQLPLVTRARLERDLAELRRAAHQIAATLGEHPSDPLLQQLLLSSYQSELALLGSLNDLSAPGTAGVDL